MEIGVKHEDEDLYTSNPLHLLCGSDNPHAYSMVQQLLRQNVNPNQRNSDGLTPVHIAAAWGKFELLKLLLLNGGDPFIRDEEQHTASEYALENGHRSCVRLIDWWTSPMLMADCVQASPVKRAAGCCKSAGSEDRDTCPDLDGKLAGLRISSVANTGCVTNAAVRSLKFHRDDQHKPRASGQKPAVDFDLEKKQCKTAAATESVPKKRFSLEKLEESAAQQDREDCRTIDPSVLNSCQQLDDKQLAVKLREEGFSVGPITPSTRSLYQKTLASFLDTTASSDERFSAELEALISGSLDLSDAMNDFQAMVTYFESPPSNQRKWREGKSKMSFCYLLMDPSITKDLPKRAKNMKEEEKLKTFCQAIFYIGKGKKTRSFEHFRRAAQLRRSRSKPKEAKHKKIIELWQNDGGVTSLDIFHNVIAVEAYTREAAMIDAIGLKHLENIIRGDYYGLPSTWSQSKRRRLGAYLLKTACDVFIAEGEKIVRFKDVP